MTKIYIFIDESGTLPDPKDRFIVLAAVATENPHLLNRFLGKSKKEIKFYSAGGKTRKLYLKTLAKEPVLIFTLCINKNGQTISDSPENYAVLSWLLLIDCFTSFRENNLEIIFDQHFNRQMDEKNLFRTMEKLFGKKLKIRSGDSSKELGIMAADMVAGALLYKQTGKMNDFFDLISNKIASEKIINWKEAKRNFIERLKNSPNRCKHPSNEN